MGEVMMESKTIKKTERGQSLTELALSFMIIMFVLSGLADLGRAFFVVIALRDAAQEGAVYASVQPSQDPNNPNDQDMKDLRKRVVASSSDPVNFSNWTPQEVIDNINVTYPDGQMCSGFETVNDEQSFGVTVTVSYNFRFSMPLIERLAQTWLEPDNTLRLDVPATHTILFDPC